MPGGATGWALLSAGFAGLTALLAKLGMRGVPVDLAVAVRTTVVLALAWGVALARVPIGTMRMPPPAAWGFLVLSGLATGASWLCYFRALSMGNLARVAAIDKLGFVLAAVLGVVVLGERPSPTLWAGLVCIAAGVWLATRG
ncbi:MAG: EamA family transporter [Armatimonadota bacterium]